MSTDANAKRHQSFAIAAIGALVCCFLLWRNGGWSQFRSATALSWEDYYLLNIALLLTPAIVYITLFSGLLIDDFGLRSGNRKAGLQFAAAGWLAFLPVIAFVAGRPEFQDYYLSNLRASRALMWVGNRETLDWGRWAFCCLVMTVYMLAWEWFFRGFLLFGLRRRFPTWFAIGFQAMLFCLLHLGKPAMEVVSSLAGGVLLGVVALRLSSMVPCFLIHILIYLSHEGAVLWFFLNRSTGN